MMMMDDDAVRYCTVDDDDHHQSPFIVDFVAPYGKQSVLNHNKSWRRLQNLPRRQCHEKSYFESGKKSAALPSKRQEAPPVHPRVVTRLLTVSRISPPIDARPSHRRCLHFPRHLRLLRRKSRCGFDDRVKRPKHQRQCDDSTNKAPSRGDSNQKIITPPRAKCHPRIIMTTHNLLRSRKKGFTTCNLSTMSPWW